MADERPPLLRLRQSARPRARGVPPPTSRAKRYSGRAISWSRPDRPEFLHRRGDTARRRASCLFRCGSCALQRAASRSGLFGCEGGSKTCRAPPPTQSAHDLSLHADVPAGEGPDALPQADRRGVKTETLGGREFLIVSREAIRLLAEEAMIDINHLLRPSHLAQLAKILDDPEATSNDRFVAYDLLKNANIAAGGVLPMCQDTGTAIVMGKKGRLVLTDGDDESAIAEGIRDAYEKKNLRYSQLTPLGMFEEKNSNTNLPAQIEIYAEGEESYKFLFVAKGGGSANKTFLFQATPSLLTHERLLAFLKEKILTLGTAACPPYHLAIVIGGTSAELNLKTVKLASTRYLDELPTAGSEGAHAFRDLAMEAE